MGINPNNHRLNQIIPHRRNDQEKQHLSPGIKSSASTTAPSKPLKHNANDEQQLSDAASGLEDETLRRTCDLNLDLTIAFPSPSPSVGEKKQETSTADLNNKSKGVLEGEHQRR